MQRGAICCSAEVPCEDQVIKGKKSSISLFKWELLFQKLIQSGDVQKGPRIFCKITVLESKEKKNSKKRNVNIHVSYTMLSKTTEICPMKPQCCALYKRIHECIMRGRNEPRKAHWKNPPGERKLFRIDEDTIHNNIWKGNFSSSLFKIHALNVKPELPYMYWVAYFSSKIRILKDLYFNTQFKASLSDYGLR